MLETPCLDTLNKGRLIFKPIALLLFLLTTSAMAMPKQFEVWFLSIDKTAFLDQLQKSGKSWERVAQRRLQCQPMGEYCFDPQVGLYKKGEQAGSFEEIDASKIEAAKKYEFMEVQETSEREMINCDENHMFDIFCGEAQKRMKAGKSKLEVWVDISSTMKQVDFDGFENECKRERFLKDLAATCPLNQKMKVYYFKEFRKEAGAFDRVCLSSGLNNMNRIMQDLENSKADNVIIVTDIFEADDKFISAIEATGRGIVRGLEKPLYPKDMKGQLKRVRKLCL